MKNSSKFGLAVALVMAISPATRAQEVPEIGASGQVQVSQGAVGPKEGLGFSNGHYAKFERINEAGKKIRYLNCTACGAPRYLTNTDNINVISLNNHFIRIEFKKKIGFKERISFHRAEDERRYYAYRSCLNNECSRMTEVRLLTKDNMFQTHPVLQISYFKFYKVKDAGGTDTESIQWTQDFTKVN